MSKAEANPEQAANAPIEKAAVLGSGVMGGAIAAHIANAGIPVVLLDIAAEGDDRDAIAKAAIARMLKTDPAPFMAADVAKLITTGNLDDNLDLLGDADWICEAVVEKLEIKHALYQRIDPVRKHGSIVSSNTSTIPLHKLIEGQSERFAADFLITHFFNPPRYMRLLEIVADGTTSSDARTRMSAFGDIRLGKDVVHCRDTPGFIANRIGIYWMTVAMREALELGLSVEEADSIVGRPMGIPKTGIFGLADLTGIDLSPQVMRSMAGLLASDDPFHAVYDEHGRLATLIQTMIAEGNTGRKGKGGFYRLDKEDGKRVKQARDLDTGTYRTAGKSDLESAKSRNLRDLVSHPDRGGSYAWRVLAKTLSYAAGLVPEITDDIASIDRAMKSGYAWKNGPFEQIDQLGVKWFVDRLIAEDMLVPPLLAEAEGAPLYREQGTQVEVRSSGGGYRPITRQAGVM
ncbi:MAG: 3-hydroxyacyl-CoA dehydrogenase family protein, partial [Proteobacteria bacterium]|nr:3-hydroxyacyl-CoA dehydrogenase family protein [Pseudomonadota bacterium]